MNISLIQVSIKFITMLIVSISSLFSVSTVKQEQVGINNADKTKSSSVVHRLVKYGTVTKYNSKVPSGMVTVLKDGQDGLSYLDEITKKYIVSRPKIDRVIEIGIGKKGEYSGLLTAYGPDCIGCDPKGRVACRDINGQSISLYENGIYYNDKKHGEVRILAADHREFPCGTVVEFTNSKMKQSMIGIVLDTGVDMRKAYEKGNIHFDLALETEKMTFNTNYNTKFTVKRWGW